ncbi:MAG TPA: CHAT domain-containing tetratricopeptide repeat protein [Bryobacteraceae bacterium]|nr:CHAT domain-containing tetratricopeptide repeat protein [Bryobacteraceae bacterium]
MKACPWLLLCVLAGCGYKQTAPVSLAERIEKLIAQRHFDEALSQVKQLSLNASQSNSDFWLATRLKSEVLRSRDGPERQLSFLSSVSIDRVARPEDAAMFRRDQAAVERQLGLLHAANKHLLQARTYALAGGDRLLVAKLDIRRARVLIELGKSAEAADCLSAAKSYADATKDFSVEPYRLNYAGWILMYSNRFEDATVPLSAAMKSFEDRHDFPHAADVMISLAWCDYRLGQFDSALKLYHQAAKLASPDDRHLCVGHLGNMFFEARNFTEAAKYYRQAADLAKEQDKNYYSAWLTDLATSLIEDGRWDEAQRPNSEALAIERRLPNSLGLRAALVNEGRIQTNQGSFAEAQETLREVTEEKQGDLGPVLDAHSALARLYEKTHQYRLAKDEYQDALKLVDTTRSHLVEDKYKLTFVASLISLHQQYVDFLMQRGDERAAFLAAESSRARVLMERLDRTRSAPAHDSIPQYQNAARDAGVTFLAYWIAPKSSYLWAISGDRFAAFRLPGGDALAPLVEQYQHSIEKDGPVHAADPVSGARLYQTLLSPARSFLHHGGRYVIVPDGPLYSLNFETLPTGSHYWIQDATVAIAPSLELLISRRPKPQSGKSLLLIGDANEWSDEYQKLIFARREMNGIARSFSSSTEVMLTGADATPTAYEKIGPGRFAYIHFAAHASANRNEPLESSIILSRVNGDGKLSVKDVLACPIHADLVTISACHSAGARTYSGEGLVGLSWAFLQAGARAVIGGLWDVNDYSSPQLMQNLYSALAQGESPATALRRAKLMLLEPGSKYANPYYWGPFQLYLGALDTRSTLLARN